MRTPENRIRIEEYQTIGREEHEQIRPKLFSSESAKAGNFAHASFEMTLKPTVKRTLEEILDSPEATIKLM